MNDQSPNAISGRDASADSSSNVSGAMVVGAKNLMRDTAAQASETLGTARTSIREKFHAVKATVADAQATVVDKASVAAKATHTYVHANPWTAVGTAAAVGVVIGMLIRRR